MTEQQEQTARESVTKSFEGLAEAAKSLNSASYFEYFDKKDFTFLNDDGTVIHSFAEFEKFYRQGITSIEKYHSLEFSKVKITVLDSQTAILVNEFKAKILLKSGDQISMAGAGTQVWSKREGDWKLVNVSSSSKPQDGPMV